jgi:hypothetical protein
MFIGRTKELSFLEAAYSSKESAFIPIYGRRRVGKSELILKFIDNKPAVYYLGKIAPRSLQIKEFLKETSRAIDEPLMHTLSTDNWSDVFSALTSKTQSKHKVIIALDEFQWLVQTSPELPSVIQEYWDRYWKKNGNIIVILCGSLIGFMERKVLGSKSPLFGRRTAQIFLQPFSYLDSAQFHPNWSLLNCAKTHFICGGIPLYLNFFNQQRSVEQNIETVILDEFGPLFREPDFLVREELREVEKYYAILMAIAAGFCKNKSIAAQTGLPEKNLHYYIQQLIQLGYISKRFPLTEFKKNRVQVRYVLHDAFLRFWFRFIFPNQSFIQQMGPKRAIEDRIKLNLDSYFGTCFEQMCKEGLPCIYQKEGVHTAFEIGEYWDKHVQIDVVGFRQDAWTDICECKWGSIKSIPEMIKLMKEKIQAFPNNRNATIQPRIFVRKKTSAMKNDISNIKWFDLSDLYDLGSHLN